MSHTIFAVSSGLGRSAIAVVRISGPNAHEVMPAFSLGTLAPRRAYLRRLRDPRTDAALDDALVLRFDAPASATGEDLVELHLHGGRAVVAGVLDALAALDDFRPAEPGEFTRRAFQNGKLDLTAAEGLADLIDAETETQREQALAQYDGGLAALYDGWRTRLLEAMALVEAGIDFSDQADVSDAAFDAAVIAAQSLETEIAAHLGKARRGEIIRNGYRVALAGPPNVGKSSLLNVLASRDVAIVSEEPGTTRDVLEVKLDLDGIVVLVVDTAGLRETEQTVEREGIRRAIAAMEAADLVLWLIDPLVPKNAPDIQERESENLIGESPSGFDNAIKNETAVESGRGQYRTPDIIQILNKSDIATPEQVRFIQHDHRISAKSGEGVEALIEAILERARSAIEAPDGAVPTAARHRMLLAASIARLNDFLEGDRGAAEFRAEDLRLAANEIGRLTGRIDPEEVLGLIFGRFCIGK